MLAANANKVKLCFESISSYSASPGFFQEYKVVSGYQIAVL